MSRYLFGWDLPPGCTGRMIEEAFGGQDFNVEEKRPAKCPCGWFGEAEVSGYRFEDGHEEDMGFECPACATVVDWTVPETEGAINSIAQLAEAIGCEPTLESVSRRVYKATSCGAHVSLLGGRGVVVGSIVEGVEQTTGNYELIFPFTEGAFWSKLEAVESEASEIWNATHGCDDCGPENDTGYRAVNPECKTCDGDGTVI